MENITMYKENPKQSKKKNPLELINAFNKINRDTSSEN